MQGPEPAEKDSEKRTGDNITVPDPLLPFIEKRSGYANYYFNQLNDFLCSMDFAFASDVETEWRQLVPVAVADFERFLQGWSPGHYKLHGWTKQWTVKGLQSV